jgi:predicted CoA-binding protein
MQKQFKLFFESDSYGVVGASSNREKYGNKVLRCYMQHKLQVIPVNPNEKTVEGLNCIASVAELSENTKSISIITPPKITERVVEQAIAKGVQNIWMQPGAESPLAIELCQKSNINVIGDGSCILVVLGYSEK